MFANSKKPNTTVGLEIETGSIAATEVRRGNGGTIARTAIATLPPGVITEGEVTDAETLSSALRSFFSKNKLGKSVRLGVANQRVVVRTLRLPLIEKDDELETAIRFQAQEHIPMPLDQAVLDHQVVAKEQGPDGDKHMDVVAVAARRDMVTSLLGALRKAGLRPVGIDLSAFGMIRALGNGSAQPQEGDIVPTTLYCHLGDITNLAVARGQQCLFTRIAPFGIENIAARVAEKTSMPLEEAREWLVEVGLEDDMDLFDTDRDRGRGRPRGARGRRLEAGRRAARLGRVLRRPGGRFGDRSGRRLRAGQHHPRPARSPSGQPRAQHRAAQPAGPRPARRRGRRPAHRLLRTRPGRLGES